MNTARARGTRAVLPLAIVSATALGVAVGGCAGPTDDASSACDLAPELAQAARSAPIHPDRLSANGVQLNGIQANGIQTNGVSLNGVSLNGVQLNGINLGNGQNLNGVTLGNGAALDGAAGNELVGFDSEGRAVSGDAFVGARIPALLSDGRTIDLVVASFERSASDEALARYRLTYEGQGICPGGESGVFVPGIWDAHGARHDAITVGAETATATFSCASGVIAKCVTWGYAPWRVGPALHQTCTRMARADYCGTGISYTRNGTRIDVFDTAGVQGPVSDPELLFEAGWNEGGAACVSRTRYDAHTASGEPVMPPCWDALPRCTTFDAAKTLGATIANASRPQPRLICD
jgi:hypothetical protein